VSSPALEAFLARLYADDAVLAAFLVDAAVVLDAAVLDPEERAAVVAIDRNALVMAARSYRAKRAGRIRPGWTAWLRRALRR
jgi:hypothetical protein